MGSTIYKQLIEFHGFGSIYYVLNITLIFDSVADPNHLGCTGYPAGSGFVYIGTDIKNRPSKTILLNLILKGQKYTLFCYRMLFYA